MCFLHVVKGTHKTIVTFLVVDVGASLEVENRHCETVVEWAQKMKPRNVQILMKLPPKRLEHQARNEFKKRRHEENVVIELGGLLKTFQDIEG